MIERILVTGGAGFIGSNFVHFIREQRPQWSMINVDALTYSGNLENLQSLDTDSHHRFVHANICDPKTMRELMDECDAVVHFAAESHVDRSIHDSTPFVTTNVLGTQTLLDAAMASGIKRFLHVSTDEVYGSLPLDQPDLSFHEELPLKPNSPYSASKAGSDLMVRAYAKSHGLDAVMTRCSNNFGPYQFPEKVIPLFVTNLIEGQKVPLYGDGKNVRDWLHVLDHCEALLTVLEKGKAGETYNIGGDNERSNLELTYSILEAMGHGEEMIEFVKDRPGHDRRYAVDTTKIREQLGWRPTRSAWPQALEDTIRWYRDNETWWRRIKSGEYRHFYEKHYGSA